VDGVTYSRLSLNDSASSSISKVTETACDIIDKAIASKKGTGKILVHCYLGISRSPMVVTAYLMKRRQMTLKAALGQIIRVLPQISPNAGFLQQLKDMEMELYGSQSLEVDELPKREEDRLALFQDRPTQDQVMLQHPDDQTHLRRTARLRDKSKLQRQSKVAQMNADGKKVAENRAKETKHQEQRHARSDEVAETSKNLVLEDIAIDKLTVSQLNRQLDYHRDNEKKAGAGGEGEKVPLKTKMGNKAVRIMELKKAVARYLAQQPES